VGVGRGGREEHEADLREGARRREEGEGVGGVQGRWKGIRTTSGFSVQHGLSVRMLRRQQAEARGGLTRAMGTRSVRYQEDLHGTAAGAILPGAALSCSDFLAATAAQCGCSVRQHAESRGELLEGLQEFLMRNDAQSRAARTHSAQPQAD